MGYDIENKDFINDLQKLIKQPSISYSGVGITDCANLVAKIMNKVGISTELLSIKTSINRNIAPLIYGEIRSKSNPNGKTLLFYNHYDVQPTGPLHLWKFHPFGGIIRDGKIFGRGSADDKGELMTRIKAVEYFLRNTGDVPCNIKFIIEGEEEIGSIHLPNYIQSYENKFKCDAIVWEFGYIDPKNRPIINLGMKGMLFVEITAIGPSVDLHSSLAVIVKNPLWRLVKVLNSIYDEKSNKILIPNWYGDIKPLSLEEQIFLQNQPSFDEKEFKEKYNLGNLLVSGHNIRKSLSLFPTCNLSNISTNQDKKNHVNTSIPSIASAKLDFRLVPNMDPQKQFGKILNHLYLNGFHDIKVKYIHGLSSSRTSFKSPFVNIVKRAAETAFIQKSVINISSAGSGPMSLLTKSSKIPCIAVGCTSIFSNIHSINEFASIDFLQKGKNLIINIINNFSSYWKNKM
ncbi:MAG TPA: M20/M25/M40 family metallo-hydrolase [Candidatus Sulfopaludibacter sp.]|nr:M20/M25/M40 family metallo-hydrolase [Candidatus Sulfopaludibacter sp.]